MAVSEKSNQSQMPAEVEHAKPTEDGHSEPHQILSAAEAAGQDAVHIKLSWRSWIVVLITCFAVVSQVYVVTAAGSVIAFIIRDMGQSALSGWIIQAPLLMQAVLSPVLGRLSDVLERKYMAAGPPLIAFAGAVLSAKATSMEMLVGGGILIGTTLSTISIVQAIPSEILPLKYRPIAQGFCGMAGTIGGLAGHLSAGAVTDTGPDGWRWVFWIQAIFHACTSLGFLFFYWPPQNREFPKMTLKEYIWICDPIGSFLFMSGSALTLLGMNWAGGAYSWGNAHVIAPLTIGLVLLVVFGVYEWKGRDDGLVAHVFFKNNSNFVYSTFAFAVEGWIFYSAVNSIVPQIVLRLGFENSSWDISVRQLSFQCVILIFPMILSAYASYFKDLKNPLLVTFTIFLVVTIFYSCIKPSFGKAQIGINVLMGIGQAGPLTLLPAAIQYTSPHAFLSTATGLAFSARAIGGAFGSAVLNAIVQGHIDANFDSAIEAAAVDAGLPKSSVPDLLAALAAGVRDGVEGATAEVWDASNKASYSEYAHAYRLAWASIIPFVVMAIVAIGMMKGVKELMTEKVEATVEHVVGDEEKPKKKLNFHM